MIALVLKTSGRDERPKGSNPLLSSNTKYMKLYINDIEVNNYAFITKVYEDRIILDREITPNVGTSVEAVTRVYRNVNSIAISKINRNVIYLDNDVNWHFHRREKNDPFGIQVSPGALIIPRSVPQAVRRVLYSLFWGNKLRVAGSIYEDWQKSVTFPRNREFEIAWRIENLRGTHNPSYDDRAEISVCTCDFCNEKRYKGLYTSSCKYYCGEDMKLLRSQILNGAM